MHDDQMAMVPFIVYESAEAKSERSIRRLIAALVVAVILLFASNALWLHAWMQYDYTSETETVTYKQDGEGYNNINTGTQGDVSNGADVQEDDEKEITH